MKVDRDLQLKLLQQLQTAYPGRLFSGPLADGLEVDHHHLCCNIAYLSEHGLVNAEIRVSSDGSKTLRPSPVSITASGIDFIEADGGLTAILGVLNIRLHEDSIKALITTQIEQSQLDESAKAQLIQSVKSLPAKGLEATVSALAQAGLARLPDAMQLLQRLVSGAI